MTLLFTLIGWALLIWIVVTIFHIWREEIVSVLLVALVVLVIAGGLYVLVAFIKWSWLHS